MKTVVSFDIADDHRRYRVGRTLEEYGQRIQYSVFELEVDSRDLIRLKSRLEGIMDFGEDRLLILPLCLDCVQAKFLRGEHCTSIDEDMIV